MLVTSSFVFAKDIPLDAKPISDYGLLEYDLPQVKIKFSKDIKSFKSANTLASCVKYSKNYVEIDTANSDCVDLNKGATVTFKNSGLINPIVLHDGLWQVGKTILKQGTDYVIAVNGFSTWELYDSNFTLGTHQNTTIYEGGSLGLAHDALIILQMEENNDTTIFDSSGYNNDINRNLPTNTTNCKLNNNCYHFDGVNDYLDIEYNVANFEGLMDFTICARISQDTSTADGSSIISTSPTSGIFNLYLSYDDARFWVRNGTGNYHYVSPTTTNMNLGQFYSVCADKNTTHISVWVDGILEGSTAITSPLGIIGATEKFSIGGRVNYPDNFFNGDLEGIQFWKNSIGKIGILDYNNSLIYNESLGANMGNHPEMTLKLDKYERIQEDSSVYKDELMQNHGIWIDNETKPEQIRNTSTNICKYGNTCLEFDGINDYINLDNKIMNSVKNKLTVSAYVRKKDLLTKILFSNHKSGGYSFQLSTNLNKLMFYIKNSTGSYTGVTSTNTYEIKDWNHVAGVYNSTHALIYLNGIETVSGITGGNLSVISDDVLIGMGFTAGFEPQSPLNGSMKCVQLWNQTLNYTSILALNNSNECNDKLLNPLTTHKLEPNFADTNSFHTLDAVPSLNENVVNGDFSSGTTNWVNNAGDAETYEVVNGELHIVESGGASAYVFAENVFDGSQKSYTLLFDFDLVSGAETTVRYWDGTGYQDIITTTGTGSYRKTFTTVNTPLHKLYFASKNGNQEYYLDNVKLKSEGGAFDFDGVNDYVSFESDGLLDFGANNSFTVSYWVYERENVLNGLTYHSSLGRMSSNKGWSFYSSPNNYFNGCVGNGIKQCGDFGSVLNEWRELTMVYYGSPIFEAEFYENGQLVDGLYTNVYYDDDSADDTIGIGVENSLSSQFFNGMIDNIKIWNRSLQESEVQTMYEQNKLMKHYAKGTYSSNEYNVSDYDKEAEQNTWRNLTLQNCNEVTNVYWKTGVCGSLPSAWTTMSQIPTTCTWYEPSVGNCMQYKLDLAGNTSSTSEIEWINISSMKINKPYVTYIDLYPDDANYYDQVSCNATFILHDTDEGNMTMRFEKNGFLVNQIVFGGLTNNTNVSANMSGTWKKGDIINCTATPWIDVVFGSQLNDTLNVTNANFTSNCIPLTNETISITKPRSTSFMCNVFDPDGDVVTNWHYDNVFNSTGLQHTVFSEVFFDYSTFVLKTNSSDGTTTTDYSWNVEILPVEPNEFVGIMIIILLGVLIAASCFFTFLLESELRFVFLLITFLLITFALAMTGHLAEDGGATQTVTNLIWFGYTMSLYAFWGMLLYVLTKLLLALKIKKMPDPRLDSPLSRYKKSKGR
jgi:hypothetical protein